MSFALLSQPFRDRSQVRGNLWQSQPLERDKSQQRERGVSLSFSETYALSLSVIERDGIFGTISLSNETENSSHPQ